MYVYASTGAMQQGCQELPSVMVSCTFVPLFRSTFWECLQPKSELGVRVASVLSSIQCSGMYTGVRYTGQSQQAC